MPVADDDGRALFGDEGADPIHIKIDVYSVGYRLIMPVLHDEILVEKTECLPGGCGSEADDERIEIEQHLTPQFVNRPVSLVHYDEIEELGWDAGIVDNLRRLALPRLRRVES